MPGDLPVGSGRLVEQEGADWEAIRAKRGRGSSPNGLLSRQVANLRDTLEERARTTTACLHYRVAEPLHGGQEPVDLVRVERLMDDGESLVRDVSRNVARGYLSGHCWSVTPGRWSFRSHGFFSSFVAGVGDFLGWPLVITATTITH